MIKAILYFGLFLSFLVLISCSKDSLKSPSASYIVFNNPTIKITSATQGSNTEKITDVWYYINDQFQGCYPIGGIVPIVASGSANIKLFAGIKNNGIADTRQPYFFYKPISFIQAIEAGETYTINPIFEYISSAKFVFKEDFESSGILFQNAGNAGDSSYAVTVNPKLVYGGIGKTLFLGMSDSKPTAKIISTTNHTLPLSGARIYMELNYNCNQEITVGVIGAGSDQRTALTLNSTNGNWNKIYIDLTTAVNTQPTYNNYKFFIAATKQIANPEIYIDNVKVITE